MPDWLVEILCVVYFGTFILSVARRSKSGRTGIREGSLLDKWPVWFFTAFFGVLAVGILVSVFQDIGYFLSVMLGLGAFLLLLALPVIVIGKGSKSKQDRSSPQAESHTIALKPSGIPPSPDFRSTHASIDGPAQLDNAPDLLLRYAPKKVTPGVTVINVLQALCNNPEDSARVFSEDTKRSIKLKLRELGPLVSSTVTDEQSKALHDILEGKADVKQLILWLENHPRMAWNDFLTKSARGQNRKAEAKSATGSH